MPSSEPTLTERRNANVPRGVATAHPLFMARGDNAELWDTDGKRFIDFASGIAVLNTGHRHPQVMKSALAQAACLTHAAFQVAGYEPYIELAERLNALAPFQGPAKTLLLTTGAEAVENAVKIARAATGRPGVLACGSGFHGRTLLTLALTGKVKPYKESFGPFPSDIFHIPYPSAYNGVTTSQSLDALDRIFAADLSPTSIAAIIIEPFLGEGGYCAAESDFVKAMRSVCDQYGIVLIADEIQAGFARTGKMFSIEHYDVEPDLVTVAKGLGGGFPISGVIGRAELMDAPSPGGLGGTFAGNPISCAAALAVLDVISGEKLMERSTALGARMQRALHAIRAEAPSATIQNVRGLGAMVAFDVAHAGDPGSPDAEATRRILQEAREAGLLLLSCGMHGNTIRLMPPLTVEDNLVDDAMEIIRTVHLSAFAL